MKAAGQAPLTLSESVPLVHALVAHVAHKTGARVLFIKGPILERQGLRGDDHTSVDVDVLVSPDQFGQLCLALAGTGWREQHRLAAPPITPEHAATLRHTSWECGVDVHRLFPGFLADPQTVFDALWRSRTSVRVAGRTIPTVASHAHAAVAALHYLRDITDDQRVRQLDDLVTRVRSRSNADSLSALSSLAAETGAAATLRPFLERVGAPMPVTSSPSPADAWRDWCLRRDTPNLTALPWLVALRRAPVRRRPRLLWQALFLSEAELRAKLPSLAAGWLPVAIARVSRLRRGLRAVPAAVSALRRIRSAP